jgi:Mitochondrial branched-chain alpha-ketoacid dehydrogenase kinase/Histidine kinase-, DNA gyrase B-, and HSP90-like ATPase
VVFALNDYVRRERKASRMASRPLATLISPHAFSRLTSLQRLSLRQIHRLSTQEVTDEHITELASKPIHRLTLADLVKHGRPPLSAQALFGSANFTLSILPSRLAQRIQALRNLPFIVVTNPHISKIHSIYMHSLSTLLPWAQKEICTTEDEVQFTGVMADLVETHAETIPVLARGFLEARRYISPEQVTKFIDEHLRARIGTRLIAEQHLALHASSQPHSHEAMSDADQNGFIGVIDTKLSPAMIIRHCEATVGDICEFKYGVRPTVVMNGELDHTFAQIPVHLEYILTELLKNAFRATIEQRMERESIEITIAPLPEQSQTSQKANDVLGIDPATRTAPIAPMSQSTPGVTIRIRDRGGGISPANYENIWTYSFTTFSEDQIQAALCGGSDGTPSNPVDGLSVISNTGGSSLAGLGYGLPLGRAYAEYFGGGISVQSLWGWGTDVYLTLKGVGKVESL